MKLIVRLPAAIAVLVLGLAGFVFWNMNTRVVRDSAEIASLRSRLSEQDRKEMDLAQRLRQAKAERAAGEAAARAAGILDSFVRDKEAELRDPALLAALAGGADWGAAAKDLMTASNQPLDSVVMCDARGLVAVVVPPNDKLIGTGGLKPEDLKLLRKRTSPRFEQDILAGGQARSLVVSVSFRGGPKGAFMGAVVIRTAFDNLLKDAAGPAAPEGDLRVLVVDKRDDVVYAPSPELVGKPIKDTEFMAVLDAREGEGTEVVYNLSRWLAVRRGAPLGMKAIGLVSLGAPGVTAAGGGEAPRQAPPYFLVILVMVVVTGVILVMIARPLGRLKSLAQSATALASGATAVEFKKAGAKDEIGETVRAVAKLGEMLAEERRHREETGNAYAQVQRDYTRVQAEARELGEYQKDLEARTRREKEALEGELQGVRTELDGARAETEEARAQVGIRDTAIVERDAIITGLNAQVREMIGELDGLRTALARQSTELSEARHELERRAAAPIASFTLLSEASDALAGELSGLLDHVQDYVGGIIETAGGAISDEQQEFLTTVINRSARSQRYLSDIRDFSNIAKPGGLAMEPVDLVTLLSDVVGTVSQAAEDKGLEFSADIPPAIPEARGDEMRLRQLFMVILQTAMRFTPEGGKVGLFTGMKGDLAGFRIEDGADPIPFSSDEVFGHFHTTEEEALELRGSGLRYPILRAIAEAHGGSIDLAINERGGNLFFVRLPVRASAPTAEMTASLFGAPDTPVAEISAVEAPAAEISAVEAPAAEISAVEAPVAEISAVEAPAAEISAVEAPAVEIPPEAAGPVSAAPDLSGFADLFGAPSPAAETPEAGTPEGLSFDAVPAANPLTDLPNGEPGSPSVFGAPEGLSFDAVAPPAAEAPGLGAPEGLSFDAVSSPSPAEPSFGELRSPLEPAEVPGLGAPEGFSFDADALLGGAETASSLEPAFGTPPLETTDTILAAAPDFTVPDLLAPLEPPSIDAIEAAGPETGLSPNPLMGLAPGASEAGQSQTPFAPEAGPTAASPEPGPEKKPEEPFSFGHDEIIQE